MFKNCTTPNNKVLVVILLAGIQLGCTDDDDGSIFDLPSLPPTVSNNLDCSNLDPGKVYLRGTLQEGLAGRDAIIDPADPTSFCLGLPVGASAEGQVSGAGKYIHAEGLTIYTMEPEPFDTDMNGADVYPATPLANDTALLTTTAAACGIGLIMNNPDNNITYYSCPNNTIHTEASVPYYSLGNSALLSVLADGSMLVGDLNSLKIVDTALVETMITIPGPVSRYRTARLFNDPITLNPSVWLVADDGVNPIQRWSLDLTTLIVTNDGDFSAVPANITTQEFASHKLDSNGDLWQMGFDTTGVFIDVIIERPILSSGAPAAVVYTEADDDNSEQYFIKIHISDLFTGL